MCGDWWEIEREDGEEKQFWRAVATGGYNQKNGDGGIDGGSCSEEWIVYRGIAALGWEIDNWQRDGGEENGNGRNNSIYFVFN